MVARPVAGEGAVGHELGRDALRLDLVGGLAEGQRLGLGEQVGHQQVVVVRPRASTGPANPMKSQGTSVVPWWSSW